MTRRLAGAAFLALLAAPGARAASASFDFLLSSGTIAQRCAEAKADAQARLARFGETPAQPPTFQDTFVRFSDIISDLGDKTSIPAFLGQVAEDKDVRDAGLACDTDISQYLVDVFTQEGPYTVLKAYAAKKERLDGEDAQLVEKTLLDFKRNGLELSAQDRGKVKEIKQKIVSIQNDFSKNVSEEKTAVALTKEQLAGMPDDYVARLKKEGGKYLVTMDYPDYYPLMENARDPEARKAVGVAFDRRGGETNVKLMEQALELREQAAKLLGYPNHAAYVLDERMAKTPDAVFKFLSKLQKSLNEKAGPEMSALLKLKNEEEGSASDGVINAWDWRYYKNKLMKTRYQVDQQEIKEYFPLDVVIPGMLRVYQTLLGLRFTEIKPERAWSGDVKLYEITDAAGGGTIAYFFMDLYPREGKYKHAAAFTLVQGRRLPDGTYQKPVSAIVANFDKPTKDRPSLLPHSGSSGDVETVFHEFGHIMHQTLTRARYERFSGTSVARDFVEAPSQMLEEWVWQAPVLADLSGHFKDPARHLPKALLEKMIAAKNATSGLYYLRQNFFATLDMTYHTSSRLDLTQTYAKLMKEVSLIPMAPGTIPEASFTHLMGGYDAGYYGYLWSKVYAEDMFSRFQKQGLLSPDVGRDYRRKVLEVGAGRDEAASLRDFLGRKPNEKAFLRSIGLR
ncbi:MAG: Zn-dependent oligopeptidase [Elusimicrobia bacterium]|nr:Zn-dependent oligopeptidase [Elusimicrobiota bacterium]